MKVREGYYSEQIRDKNFGLILDELSNRQREVLEVIKQIGPCTSEQIAELLGRYPHTITPRVLELRKLDLVEYSHEGKSPAGRPVSYWKIKRRVIQLNLIKTKN